MYIYTQECIYIYKCIHKHYGSNVWDQKDFFCRKSILLFSKDILNESKVTVIKIIM